MFGIGATDDEPLTQRPRREDIAALAPYADADRNTLDTLLAASALRSLDNARVPSKWFEGHALFLHSGQVEIRLENTRRLFLSSVSPPARFPLPPAAVAGISALGTATLLQVPFSPTANTDAIRADFTVHGSDPLLATLSRIMRRKLDDGDIPLPSMPELAVRLNGALRERGADRDDRDVAKLIQLDPALATKVIHAVNSAAFRFARRADSVQQAVTRLGRERIRNLAVGFLLRHAFHTNSAVLRKRANALWLRSCHIAAISFTLARQLPMLDAERAMLAGLIHQIGALPILGMTDRNPELFGGTALVDRAVNAFARPLGRFVIERWQLGDDMLDVVQYAGDYQRIGHAVPDYADVVVLAQLHADMGRPGFHHLPRFDSLPAFRKLELGRLTPRKSLQALADAEQEILELRRILSGGS